MGYQRDPRVDAYIAELPGWQSTVCEQVRELVHAADPDVVETIKRTRQPYFVLDGNICALLATRDHVNVFLYDGGIVDDPDHIITGGHDNATARTVAIYEDQPVNARALAAMFGQIIANNRAGGWRALKQRRARVEDVQELALGLPHVTVVHGAQGNPVYQVGGRSFVFFRTPRPDAVDPGTGQRLPDVIVFWVESEADKQALVQDPTTPFFTTPHFDGHDSVLVQAGRIGELSRGELAELVQDAWLARASPRRRADWLAAHSPPVHR